VKNSVRRLNRVRKKKQLTDARGRHPTVNIPGEEHRKSTKYSCQFQVSSLPPHVSLATRPEKRQCSSLFGAIWEILDEWRRPGVGPEQRQPGNAYFIIGIESPDDAPLIAMRKKQNARRSIAQSIYKLYAAGLFVTAGFIVGFDSKTPSVADAMIELIEEAAIPVCMVGLPPSVRADLIGDRRSLEELGVLEAPPS